MNLRLYRLIVRHMTWPLRGLIWLRSMRGLEEPTRGGERQGIPSLSRPAGKLIWIHAASIGEMRSILPLARHLLSRDSDLTCLITTVTVTAARLVRRAGNARIIHQYAPFDHPTWVERFIDFWQPSAAIWVESELWPNTLGSLKASKVPLMLVNGRLSERSFQRWSRIPMIAAEVMAYFDAMLAQTDEDMKRLSALGAQNVTVAGNMKYSGDALPVDSRALADVKAQLAGRTAVLFASTHDGEDHVATLAWDTLAKKYPGYLSIVMPRHPSRGDAIATQYEKDGYRVARRSLNQPILPETQVYIADTLGEPGLFYRLCPIVFMGNSLISRPGGGHNPVEPAQLGCAVVYGPHMWNFAEIDADLRGHKAALRVRTPEDLVKTLDKLLASPVTVAGIGKAGREFVAEQNGVLMRVVAALAAPLSRGGIAS